MTALADMTMAQLLDLHNRLAETPAGPKTFSTKAKIVARIEKLAEAKGVNPDSLAEEKETANTEEDEMARSPAALIDALLNKTVERGCTEGEEAAAIAKALEVMQKNGIDPTIYSARFPEARYQSNGQPKPKPKPEAKKPEAKKAEEEPKAEKPKQRPSGRTIRTAAEQLLLKVVGVNVDKKTVGMPYEDILAEIKKEFPDARTTVACLRWYVVRMNERQEVMPQCRPRKMGKGS